MTAEMAKVFSVNIYVSSRIFTTQRFPGLRRNVRLAKKLALFYEEKKKKKRFFRTCRFYMQIRKLATLIHF